MDKAYPDQNQPSGGETQEWLGHLIELRMRLIHIAIAVFVMFGFLSFWSQDIFLIFADPMLKSLPEGAKMISTDVTSNFFVPLKFVLWVSFVMVMPYVLHQIWLFIAPGLYAQEKRAVLPIVVTSYLFFLIGTGFAYFFVFPSVFKVMVSYTPEGVQMATDINNYLSFGLMTFFAFGLTFEIPVVVVVLVYLNMVQVEDLKKYRPYIIALCTAISALVTPPDALSMIMLAIPMCLLFELGVFVAGKMTKRSSLDQQPL